MFVTVELAGETNIKVIKLCLSSSGILNTQAAYELSKRMMSAYMMSAYMIESSTNLIGMNL